MKQLFVTLAIIAILITVSCKPKTTASVQEPAAAAVQAAPAEMHKMITAKIFIKPGREEDFANAAKWMIENTLKEEGCLQYTLYQDPYNKSDFFFFERYKSQAAIDAHFGASYFTEFGNRISDMTSQASEIRIWDLSESKQTN